MKTKRHQLSPAEKTLVVKVYSYFVEEAELGRNYGRDSRQRTAVATGFGVSTIQRVLAAYNSDPGTNFAAITPSTRGRKKKYKESEFNTLVRQYVVAQNRAMMPVTAQLICNYLEEVLNQDFNARTMRTYLNNMGFKHLRGQNRHYLAESVGNVAFRATYLSKRLSNRDARGHPVLPEVFLDESYCNVNHVAGKTWLTEDKVRYSTSGRGAR
ncbi:hypothetical protein PR003_g4048 [Phytophthora rubi]|nr:hypothetical protein PF003_g23860 [Phytophthora fragariae]KAE9040182.1 hypothetical protein PR002_g5092 [Phytophthora rubi]KAE9016346.1 hypothetical protein PF011_g7199 [Phytophthora fragariae]KAE9045277.1 hypothetical protein PR001_g5045 [Phytophthora rubi]KAE9147357.1 hypothetical protein PF006_g7952 [Phytophthora fragariae]